jgi:hypothetical protein
MPEVTVIDALFFAADGTPVEKDDPAAARTEVRWLDAGGHEHTDYGTIGR